MENQKNYQKKKGVTVPRKSREESINFDKLIEDIKNSSPETSLYLGADSKTFKKGKDRFCAYCVTVVLHMDSKHGAKLYKDVKIERDYGEAKSPRMRLMNEVYKVVEIASKLIDAIGDRHYEIHLDVSPHKENKSNEIVREACGYVFGSLGIDAMIKPDAFAASYAADRFAVKAADASKEK